MRRASRRWLTSVVAVVGLALASCTGAPSGSVDDQAFGDQDGAGTARDSNGPAPSTPVADAAYVVPSEFSFPESPESVKIESAPTTVIRRSTFRMGPVPVSRLVELARLAVRGRVESVSAGRFNSDHGGPWNPEAHATKDGRAVAREAWHEVRVEVTEVLGDAARTGVEPGDFVVYKEPGIIDFPDPNGNTVGYRADTEAVYDIGDDVLVLLDWERLAGLHNGRVMERYELMVVSVGQYMFQVQQDMAVSADSRFHDEHAYPDVDPLQLPLSELRQLVAQRLGNDAGEVPVPGLHELPPHPPVDDSGPRYTPPPDVPPHTHGEGG